ncbi:alpha/beta-hydrolase [Cylindrobasidium torrendii FP15055 ss-10]|uniref:Alpha/beta-hydrolase n=1 Tax=Cylindrobasidium torrendii FP15055 ss-10 TaxID=1314674 RepID=A0A0D7B9Z8_9AGAR|nr:alpha/beta-hydrolase [Cylindrobasidium torrendii FP15055 ss-10]
MSTMSAAMTPSSMASGSASSVSLPLPLPPADAIPSAFGASVRQWWAAGEKQGAIAEERLLRRLPFYRGSSLAGSSTKCRSSKESTHSDSTFQPEGNSQTQSEAPPTDPGVSAFSSKVPLPSNPKHFLNTFTMSSTSPRTPSSPPPAVLLHGYGAGLGFFFHNYLPLSQWASRRSTSVYAVDWLGMGRSARPPFSIKSPRSDTAARVAEAESFFIDALEEWRGVQGLERMTLIGHSLGAYFSLAYALKYPERVARLVLLSPAGVPRAPGSTVLSAEVDAPDGAVGRPGGMTKEGTEETVRKVEETQNQVKERESRARKLFTYLWEEGWSPFQVVRSAFVWGPMLVGKYSARRFPGLDEQETRDMHAYMLNITLAKGSGEYCISHILAPGAHARMPMVDRVKDIKVPVTFVYGDHDWMDPEGGRDAVEKMREAGNGEGRMYVVGNAGHHLYIDNPKLVNDLLVKELERT